ncbi:MAG: DNA adenine methylase [Firmicutes bacterium]|nr:DNA adenine methylase [Bacillota bacterium]
MRPFLKWAGGKTQLLDAFEERLPRHIKETKTITRYIEPFVGGGAMFFFLKSHYRIDQSYLFDINADLIICYKVLQNSHRELIDTLEKISSEFFQKTEEERKTFYYQIRELYNEQQKSFNYEVYSSVWIERAGFLIFLNKTCYNGLFRLNQKGEFNVPYGRYKKPKISDPAILKKVNLALQNTQIFCGDFTESEKFVTQDSFVYLDPPYRPLNSTSNFTSYSKDGFSDSDQKRLAEYFGRLKKKGAYLMLSNSDPKNEDPDDNFFETIYEGYRIERVPAKRYINCDAQKRGAINELIIRNYD